MVEQTNSSKENYISGRKFSDQHDHLVIEYLKQEGLELLPAPEIEDINNLTDFWIDNGCFRLASRLRDYYEVKYEKVFARWKRQITVRETEIDKYLRGLGDYLFYGWVKDGKLLTAVLVENAKIAAALKENRQKFQANMGGLNFYSLQVEDVGAELVEF